LGVHVEGSGDGVGLLREDLRLEGAAHAAGQLPLVETGAKGEMRGINGGILKPDREGPWPGNMLFYVRVDDLAAYRKKIVDAGGVIHVEEQEVPGMGWLSLFTDPEGRMNGLWKAKAAMSKKKPAKKAGKAGKKKS